MTDPALPEDFEESVYYTLTESPAFMAALAANSAGPNIWPDAIPDQAPLPAATYSTSETHFEYNLGAIEYDEPTINITIWAQARQQAKAAAKAAIAAFAEFNITITNSTSGYHNEVGLFFQTVTVKEGIPT